MVRVTNPANGREYKQPFQVVDFGPVSLLGAEAAKNLELVAVIKENTFTAEHKAVKEMFRKELS